MVNADEALRLILSNTPTLGLEKIALAGSLGRVVATDIVAPVDLPLFDNSSMDGYAVISTDLSEASKEHPRKLDVIGESSAGNVFRSKVRPGQAVKVMTGGKIPGRADAVVPVELVGKVGEKSIAVTQPVNAGQYIRRVGEDIRSGETVMRVGETIRPPHMGVLASLGRTKVRVFRLPRVNILATGDELVDVDEKPSEGQIRNSNSHMLAGYVRQAGGIPFVMASVRDKKKRIREAIKKAPDADVLLITGGVSVGAYDFVKGVLEDWGVHLIVQSVNIKPGRPLVFGRRKNMIIFGLPGNPVSTSVTFLQLVRPALQTLSGQKFTPPLRHQATMDGVFEKHDGKRHFVRGVAKQVDGRYHVQITGTQSSGALSSMVKANCLIIIPEAVTSMKPGDQVEIELL